MADRSLTARKGAASATLCPMPVVRRGASLRPNTVPGVFRHSRTPVSTTTPPVLLPLIGIDDDLDMALEGVLHPIAVRAQGGDRAARDGLYTAFEPKLRRFIGRIRVPFAPDGCKGLWERDDVAQEAYLTFVGVIESWPPQIPFGRYVLAHFPWRLRDAVHRGVGRRTAPPRMFVVPILDGESLRDRAAGDHHQRALIEALAASFEPPLDDLLRLRILDGQTVNDTAASLGISRRSATRHWRTILIRLRADERRQG